MWLQPRPAPPRRRPRTALHRRPCTALHRRPRAALRRVQVLTVSYGTGEGGVIDMRPDALAPLAGLRGLASLTLNDGAGVAAVDGLAAVGGHGWAYHGDRGPCKRLLRLPQAVKRARWWGAF